MRNSGCSAQNRSVLTATTRRVDIDEAEETIGNLRFFRFAHDARDRASFSVAG